MSPYTQALAGGVLLGGSASLLLLANGRVLGVSGIIGNLLGGSRIAANAAFLMGLLAGPFLFLLASGRMPPVTVLTPWPQLVAGGLLVGIGTRIGSGCTSGHGIVGLARFSPRSIVATLVFLVVGMGVATFMETLR
ncbi:YeeE/YedE family protein [Acetobacteraceae bacterium KSS8]|uniref:YeeE/YedE family protein n=1 Tax=Endosaccharibacter trunci TaxID=2812733 RepID=A0ABT1W8P7_9PROT|nr:YeeE/YedE family protein [Acetobacteraceae bacterium KSS8]